MALREDRSLWYRLSGCVAAWQPIAAPNPLLARYNQRDGGDNRYKAVDGVAPTWHGATGWTFNGTTQYLDAGVIPQGDWTLLVRIVNGSLSGDQYFVGLWDTSPATLRWALGTRQTTAKYLLTYKAAANVAVAYPSSDFVGLVANSYYANGSLIASGEALFTSGVDITAYIGARNTNNAAGLFWPGSIQALAIYNRTLSPAEVFAVSRQMAHVERNPDWSAWGRRRQWFYAPADAAAAGGVKHWAIRRANPAIGSGAIRGNQL